MGIPSFAHKSALFCATLSLALLSPGIEQALGADTQVPEVAGEVASELASPPATVRFRGEPLLVVRDVLGPLSPDDRARAIENRINALSARNASVVDMLASRDRLLTTDIVVGDKVLMTVTDRDAHPTGRSRQQLAADWIRLLEHRLAADFHERSVSGVVGALLYSLIALAVTLVLFFLLRFSFRRAAARLQRWKVSRLESVEVQKLLLLPVERIMEFLDLALRSLYWFSVGALFLICVNTVLSFFPWTRAAAESLFQHLYNAGIWVVRGILGYLPNVLYIAVIVTVAVYILRFFKFIFNELEKGTINIPGFYSDWSMPTYKIVRFLFLAFVAVIVFPYLPGAKTPAFQGVSLFLGLLLSLGSTAAVANIVAGVVLTYMRPFSVGDRVKLADTVGDVIEKTLLVVRIRTTKNVEITVANAMVLNNHIINFSACAKDRGVILHTSVTIGYDVPWQQVHKLLIEAARSTGRILEEPAPFVLQTSLDDFYVGYELNAYTDQPNRMAAVYSEMHANIQDRFNEAGVEILSPHYRAARDGNAMAVPSDYLPKDYRPPAFRVRPLSKVDPESA